MSAFRIGVRSSDHSLIRTDTFLGGVSTKPL